ncbi:pilus assembly protein TadG-related protein [Ureibacillus xyleni]|uniref:pilus assembly protein TadG-related protein n=1 Tax=Ureibacillus xyleni TaxID=614648 RepID=UPI000C7CEA18|nr:pilus assembly protein TadG-related protein [Ureibacillus xyleni]
MDGGRLYFEKSMLQKAADAAALAGAQELPLDSIEAEKYARDVAIKNEILDVNTIVEFA